MTGKDNTVNPRYEIGQKVIIRPVSEQPLTLRENDISSYAGRTGAVSNHYWISPRIGKVFYIYTVRADNDYKEIVVYEDEIEACLD